MLTGRESVPRPEAPQKKRGADKPLVTVVIPCYNQGHFLAEAIESVLSQSYQRYEIIVVDDGSTDDTSEVASRYQKVRYARQDNQGVSAARNTGLAESKGEYVVFLDADDRLLPEALEVGVGQLEAHPESALVSGRCRIIAGDGSFLRQPPQHDVDEDRYVALLQGYVPGPPAVVMYRREVLESVGGFDGSVDAAADYDLYLRIARRFRVCSHEKMVAERRQHDTNMTHNSGIMLSHAVATLRAQRKYIKGNKRYEEAYKAGIRGYQRHDGRRLVDEVRTDVQRREWKRVLGGVLVLLRYYPRGLALLSERRMERERRDLARRLRRRKLELEAHERRLKELEGTQEAASALVEEHKEVRLLRRRIRGLERRMQSVDQLARIGRNGKTRRLLKRFVNIRAKVLNLVDRPAHTQSAGIGGVPPAPTGLDRRRDRDQRTRGVTTPTVALLPWGDVWEDYLDTIGISLEEFLTEVSGTWLFGYIQALGEAGIRTVLVLWSRDARQPYRRVHVPTGTTVWVLPQARTHQVARRLDGLLRVRRLRRSWLARHLRRTATSVAAHYTATPPRDLARVLRQEGCGAVLVQEYHNPRFDVCVLLGRWLGLPVLATFQGDSQPRTQLEGWVRRWTVPAAGGLLVGARREAEAVAERYRLSPDAVSLVPNPIDVEEWTSADQAAARSALGLPAEVPVACWHGRTHVAIKGLDILVEAWRQVCAERPDADLRLLLCGGGDGSKRLRRLIARAGLRGVHWRDEYVLDRAVVRRQLAASDVFVLPSRSEGFAVAPMEAMACGRPVVASDALGVADLLAGGEKGGGVVVPREDPGALARALGRLLDDRALAARLGEAARRRVVERYSPEVVGLKLAAALHRAAPESFPAPPSPPP